MAFLTWTENQRIWKLVHQHFSIFQQEFSLYPTSYTKEWRKRINERTGIIFPQKPPKTKKIDLTFTETRVLKKADINAGM